MADTPDDNVPAPERGSIHWTEVNELAREHLGYLEKRTADQVAGILEAVGIEVDRETCEPEPPPEMVTAVLSFHHPDPMTNPVVQQFDMMPAPELLDALTETLGVTTDVTHAVTERDALRASVAGALHRWRTGERVKTDGGYDRYFPAQHAMEYLAAATEGQADVNLSDGYREVLVHIPTHLTAKLRFIDGETGKDIESDIDFVGDVHSGSFRLWMRNTE